MSHRIYFVVDPIECIFDLPFEIDENIILRRANPHEINVLEVLEPYGDFHISKGMGRLFFVKHQPIVRFKNKSKTRKSSTYKALPRDEYRCYVFDVNCTVEDKKYFRYALRVSRIGFSTFLTTSPDNTRISYGLGAELLSYLANYDQDKAHYHVEKFEKSDAEEIKVLFNQICNLDKEKYNFIINTIYLYDDSFLIFKYTNLYIIALFTVIESILTHNRYGDSESSSITQQLKSKIIEANSVFDESLIFEKYFQFGNTTKIETIVEKLYKVRSEIVHGGHINFSNTQELSRRYLLKSKELLIEFLQNLIKKLIHVALKHPEYILILKNRN